MNAPRRHPLAKADIEREARWYDAQQPGFGTDFLDEVKRIIGVIAEQPLRYNVRFGNWRRANLRRFPHAVFTCMVFPQSPGYATNSVAGIPLPLNASRAARLRMYFKTRLLTGLNG